ncbi:type II toxin-antitoxin system RelE/ParE family toxin [Sedimentibacter hydroxybenzoicus DSM 7310]|uniref:Type II toxin-antitoxin system RelE/ParE family toxin n=1 Tax=Sedimentibacter hydroxybenzoicus DSM 7310 TaxID=1123245 RepID=A0A974BK90_SEDHY|nr:type II toxin-antitoxin system RelE/ParE family toxin [Sedimentibacter hydroxybenzoicus]NYB74622.1 type II toxin-antitoxin system RelE/ParE family toxin [Sedimentibacter hydroxybenzoicus DSM 7310]
MNIIYKKSAIKFLKNADRKLAHRIIDGISGLTKEPPEGDIKPMQGRKDELRLRIGKYRIIYKYDKNTLEIIDVDSRGDIYK